MQGEDGPAECVDGGRFEGTAVDCTGGTEMGGDAGGMFQGTASRDRRRFSRQGCRKLVVSIICYPDFGRIPSPMLELKQLVELTRKRSRQIPDPGYHTTSS